MTKYIFIFNQYALRLSPYPTEDYVGGWMADEQNIWRITHKNKQT